MAKALVRLLALMLMLASGLFVALMAAGVGCVLGVIAGYSSSVVLQSLLPRLFSGESGGSDWLMLCGGVVGGLGGLLLIARAIWTDLKKIVGPKL